MAARNVNLSQLLFLNDLATPGVKSRICFPPALVRAPIIDTQPLRFPE